MLLLVVTPLAAGLLFALSAFYPQIVDAPLPVTFILGELGVPAFSILIKLVILGALVGRARTGRGAHLDISMTEGALALLASELGNLDCGARPTRRE